METLIIYDTTGYIISQIKGAQREPEGVPFIKVNIPDGQYAVSVDVKTQTPVLESFPLSETAKQAERIQKLESRLEQSEQEQAKVLLSLVEKGVI